jgi:DNA-binding NtrC family response regulator
MRQRLTLVLDPQDRIGDPLYLVLRRNGHLVAVRRNALDCLEYVSAHHPALVMLRLATGVDRLSEAIQQISPRTRVMYQGPEGKWTEAAAPLRRSREDELRQTVERLLDQEMRERA